MDADFLLIHKMKNGDEEKIEDDPGHPAYIQTVRGVGYRFNGNLGSE